MTSQASISDYFRLKKRARVSDGSSEKSLKKFKDEKQDFSPLEETPQSVIKNEQIKQEDEPQVLKKEKKHPEKELTKLLSRPNKLSDLQDILKKFNNGSKKLEEFREKAEQRRNKEKLQSHQEAVFSTASPSKSATIYKSFVSSPSKSAGISKSYASSPSKSIATSMSNKPSPSYEGRKAVGRSPRIKPALETITPEKFYSPSKNLNENIFASPKKLNDITSPSKSTMGTARRNLFPSDKEKTEACRESSKETQKSASSMRYHDKQNVPAYERYNYLTQKPKEVEEKTTEHTSEADRDLPLPFKYRVLEEHFIAMESFVSILHNRKEMITFSKVKSAVQTQVRRIPFKERHLGQILTVLPGCYKLCMERVKALGSNVPQQQLIISSSLSCNEPMTPAIMVERRRQFHKKLLETAHKHHRAFLGTLDPPVVVPDSTPVTRWHPKFRLDDVPNIEAQRMPAALKDDRNLLASEVMAKAQDIISQTNPRMKKAMEELLKRKNPTDSKTIESCKEEQTNSAQDSGSPEVKAKNLKNSKLNNSKMLGISKSLLDKIREREKVKALMSVTQTPEELKRKKMLRKLPEMVRILRNVFVCEKKSALGLDIVMDRLSHSNHGVFNPREIEEYIKLIEATLPRWIKIHRLTQGHFVKMQKNIDINELIEEIERNNKKEKL